MTNLKALLEAATPGPWHLFIGKNINRVNCGDARHAGDYQRRVADVIFWSPGHTGAKENPLREAADANARLIALAPTLAAALIEAENALEVYADSCDATETSPCGYEGNQCCMTARAALDRIRAITGGRDE